MKYAFVVAASENYLPGIKALFSSIEIYCPHIDVLFLPHGSFPLLPHSAYSFKLLSFNTDIEHQVHGTAIERFRIAIEYGRAYDAICLLDADMFLCADPTIFFDVAAKGFIVTGSNGMAINFNRAYQDQYHMTLEVDDYPYYKVHTTAPIFLSPSDFDWFEELYNSKRIDSWDDFLYLNLLGIKLGKDKRMICMSPSIFTGIHHFLLKPNTRAMERDGKLITETEEEIYMVHGKWWDEGWLSGLMQPMEGFASSQRPIMEVAIESRDIMKRRFDQLASN